MSASVARLLIDHKDNQAGNNYGSLIQTGCLVLFVQGTLLFVVCWLVAPWLAVLLDIPQELQPDFIGLMRWQGATLALNFFTRIFGTLLYAHQRIDLGCYIQTGAFAVNLVALWWFFHCGHGVYSLVWSGLVNVAVVSIGSWFSCWRLGFFPVRGSWGRPSRKMFDELFSYGKDLFLMALGGQMIVASQTMIITRQLGLEAAALWAVGTKAYNLVWQLIWRTADASNPGLAEMLARGEETKLRDRYRTVVTLSTSFAAFCAVAYVLCNSPFVTVWTSNKFSWKTINDVFLGACLLVGAIIRCCSGLVGTTKEIRFMRYIYFIEGTVFVGVALGVARSGQLYTIILASLACSLLFTCNYGIYRVAHFFRVPMWEVAWGWLLPIRRYLLRVVPVAVLTWWLTRPLPPLPRFAIHGFVSGTLGLYLLAKYGVPSTFQEELIRRVPVPVARVLRWVFVPVSDVKGQVAMKRET
jgi:O-antigen/teichoic acid export membrane protein